MNSVCLAVAVAACGVDTGWQPLPEGGYEYIIQIEPDLVETLVQGESLTSEIPSSVRSVRRYRIVVGTSELPRIDPPEEPEDKVAADPIPGFDSESTNSATLDDPAPAPPPQLQEQDRRASAAPPPLPELPGAEKLAGHEAPAGEANTPPPDAADSKITSASDSAGPGRPWGWLLLTLLGLFASLSGNAYLGWITWDTRKRYRALLHDSRGVDVPDA